MTEQPPLGCMVRQRKTFLRSFASRRVPRSNIQFIEITGGLRRGPTRRVVDPLGRDVLVGAGL